MQNRNPVIAKVLNVLVFLFLYLPIAVLIIFSFNDSKSRTVWSGFSLHWYQELFQDEEILSAFSTTLTVSVLAALIATVLGTAAAIGFHAMKRRPRHLLMTINNIPMTNADIITGVSLMLLFVFTGNMLGFSLGFGTLLVAHITFNIPYVVLAVLPKLRQLEEEEPQLRLLWENGQIHVQMMGRVQQEVFRSLVQQRFALDVTLSDQRIFYKETIENTVEGVGHFEPLRHYAEVHLLLEPAERGTGLTFDTSCSEDVLDRNWQRLILTHLAEKCHRGVLTGAPLTDVKITLLAGRAHVKHTEGGDFRQATWRAVRQGLMQAESVLLEPYYAFRIEVPAEQIGRAISDVRLMCGTFSSPETHGDMAVLTGRAPVSTMRDYPAEVAAYTRGRGRISCTVAGYDTCHNAQEVIEESGYDPTRDLDNTPDSVFCAHGAGTVIPWDRVRDYMHIDTGFGKEQPAPEDTPRMFRRRFDLDDRELEQILQREFGPIRRAQYAAPVRNAASGADDAGRAELFHPRRERVIVDGYNVIFAWDELRALADSGHIDAARERLMDALSNYAAFTRREVVVVFDGYRVPGGQGEKFDRSGLHVVFTRQGETADAYMEKLADEIGKNDSVRVVTSDALIQLTALRAGVLRMSAREFRQELAQVAQQLEAAIRDLNGR